MKKQAPHRGSGNAKWVAAGVPSRFKPGRPGLRVCAAKKRGVKERCGQLALNGLAVCWYHGGSSVVARRRMKRRQQMRHHAWTDKGRTSEPG